MLKVAEDFGEFCDFFEFSQIVFFYFLCFFTKRVLAVNRLKDHVKDIIVLNIYL